MKRFYSATTTLRYPAVAINLPLASRSESHTAVISTVIRKAGANVVRIINYLLGANISYFAILFVVLVAVLAGLNLVLANNLSNKGGEVRVLESRKAVIVKENEELRNGIAELSSLSRIKKDAAEQLGMVEAASTALDYLRPPKFASR